MIANHHPTTDRDVRPVRPREYAKALALAWDTRQSVRDSVSDYRDAATLPGGVEWYLSRDRLSGFGVRLSDGELIGLFSLAKGRGDHLVASAVHYGARRLDCFDGYLVKLYERHGFVESRREQNWTPGGRDVVYMSIPRYCRTHDLYDCWFDGDPSLSVGGRTNPEGGYTP